MTSDTVRFFGRYLGSLTGYVNIVYPDQRLVDDDEIFEWFCDAASKNLINPQYLGSITVSRMTEALVAAGLIVTL